MDGPYSGYILKNASKIVKSWAFTTQKICRSLCKYIYLSKIVKAWALLLKK